MSSINRVGQVTPTGKELEQYLGIEETEGIQYRQMKETVKQECTSKNDTEIRVEYQE
jgi:hypothetical protein